jgi:hypothetical protein
MNRHEALTTNEFGPLIRPLVPAEDVMVALAIADHENAMAALIGPAPAASFSISPNRPTVEQEVADAIARHGMEFPAPRTGHADFAAELEAALARHDADFPPLKDGEPSLVAGR